MEKFGRSQPVKRVEDVRFLTGQGRYVDDLAPAGALTAVFVRATVAHGDLGAMDLDDVRAMPGVALVLTADDLLAAGMKIDISGGAITNRDGTKGAKPFRPILAVGRCAARGRGDCCNHRRDTRASPRRGRGAVPGYLRTPGAY